MKHTQFCITCTRNAKAYQQPSEQPGEQPIQRLRNRLRNRPRNWPDVLKFNSFCPRTANFRPICFTLGFALAAIGWSTVTLAQKNFSTARNLSHLSINIETGITSADPGATNLLPNSVWVQRNVFNQLFEFDINGRVQKGLVSRALLSADGKTVQLRLRKNIWFQSSVAQGFTPTRPLDARDVIFTFNPEHHSAFPYWTIKGLDKLITSMRIDENDSSLLTLTLSEPRPDLYSVFAMAAFSIKSEEHWKFTRAKDLEWRIANPSAADNDPARPANLFEKQPVGTGPFQIASLNNGRMELHAVSPKTFPQEISLIPELDSHRRVENVIAGTVDVATSPSVYDFIEARNANPELAKFLSAPSQNINFLAVNMQSPALTELKDQRVRQAISLSIDREQIVQKIFAGEGQAAVSFIDPANFSHVTAPEIYIQNIERAKELIAASGASGKALTLLYLPAARPYNPDPLALAQELKKSIEGIGLNVRLATIGSDSSLDPKDRKPILNYLGDPKPSNFQPDFAMYSAYVKKEPNFDIAQYGDNPLAPAAVADERGIKVPIALDRVVNVTTAGIGTSNYARYSNLEVDRLYHALNHEFDSAKRETIMIEIDRIIAEDLPIIPIGKVNVLRVVSTHVNYLFDPTLQIERLKTRPAVSSRLPRARQCNEFFGG